MTDTEERLIDSLVGVVAEDYRKTLRDSRILEDAVALVISALRVLSPDGVAPLPDHDMPRALVMLRDPTSQVPKRTYHSDTGYDLAISATVHIPANSFADVPTGVYMQAPEGFWSRITGRSSSLRKHGVLVNEGIIDEGYRGELFVGCWNLRGVPVTLVKGTRIAQLIFHRRVDVEWNVTRSFTPSERQESGFGSTGE